MSDRVIIEHEDGRRFSVLAGDPRTKEDGWHVEGDETDASFVATGIRRPKKPRKRPAAKAAKPVTAPETEPAP